MDSSLLTTALENRLLAVLAALSFVLLIVVTLGVCYLTAVEWRDRRRRGAEASALPTLRASSLKPTNLKPSNPKSSNPKSASKASKGRRQ